MGNQRQAISVLLGIAAATVLAATASADIIHVPGDFPTIQAAILAALEGDEIVVAPGVYNEAIFFNGHNITLRSSGGPDVTTIDATGLNNHAVRCILGEGPTTVVQGFTITGSSSGSGLFCDSSSPTVINCRFIGNQIDGIFNDSFSFTTVIDCTMSNNGSHGMRNTVQSDVTVTRCTFADNGISGMSNQVSAPVVKNCAFRGNGGQGMSNDASLPTVANSLFTGSPSGVGAGTGSDVLLLNCTVSGNTDAGVVFDNSNITVTNCIIWNNGAASISGTGTAVVSYSDIEFGWPGSDFSILANPMFVSPNSGDYRLSPGSPCIDLANNAALPLGIDTDLDGNPRFVDDPKTPDCPQPGADCGDRPIVDMGAYEFQISACLWDLDGNETVGILDLLALLAAWGSDPGGPPDFDGDGNVGILDLLALLANWGPCA